MTEHVKRYFCSPHNSFVHTFIQVMIMYLVSPDPYVFLMDALVMIFKNINRKFFKLIATVMTNHNLGLETL